MSVSTEALPDPQRHPLQENRLERFIEEESREMVSKITGVLPVIRDAVDGPNSSMSRASCTKSIPPGDRRKKQVEETREPHLPRSPARVTPRSRASTNTSSKWRSRPTRATSRLAGDLSRMPSTRRHSEHQEHRARVSALDEELKAASSTRTMSIPTRPVWLPRDPDESTARAKSFNISENGNQPGRYHLVQIPTEDPSFPQAG